MNATQKNWYQEPMVWMLIGIPASSVVFGAVMLWLAITNKDSLVADDYYKRGMEINRLLAREAAATEYGLSALVYPIAETGGLAVTLESGQEFFYPPSVTLDFYHASDSDLDVGIILERSGDKTYTGTLPDLLPGRWYLSLSNEGWRISSRIRWPGDVFELNAQLPQQDP